MTGRHDLDATLPWMREGTAHLLAVVGKLTDDELRAPSALPGWSRAHVVGHVARNAEAQWRAQVRSALGRAIPAAEVPWMRIREVWLHAVDLDAGATVADLPDGVLDLLLDEVTAVLSGEEGCPALELAPGDRSRTWRLGRAEPEASVAAPAADLVGWLTGRTVDTIRPALPPWL